jgi:hypothetical protein
MINNAMDITADVHLIDTKLIPQIGTEEPTEAPELLTIGAIASATPKLAC